MTCWGRVPRGRSGIRRVVVAALLAPLALAALAPVASAHSRSITSPLAGSHGYRHGLVPLRPGKYHRGSNPSPGPATGSTSLNDLNFGGGISGVGVTNGAPKVYLVFWGSQWGTATGTAPNVTLSGDPHNTAAALQAFFTGLGTGNEQWSGVMTQYCEGIGAGVQSCPSDASAPHVGYPSGGALAGVWVDESSAAPQQASGNQIGAEAVKAAANFGNTSAAANRDAQYVILSPTATHPDGFNTPFSNWCAWHDYTGDSTLSGGAVSSPYGPLAFTNMPYVDDLGTSCGQNFVNAGSAGTNDGVTIVEGHEYAETITDQFPASGWTDNSGSETGDKCAWISSGQGASANIALTTGTFAVQSTWANDFNGGAGGCELSHAFTAVTSPGNQSGNTSTAVTLPISAGDSDGGALTYSASGLPAGLTIDPSTGVISGTPTTAGTSTVTVAATDANGPTGTATFTWTVSGVGDFSIAVSPTSASVTQGGSTTATVSTTTTTGSAQSVSLSASGLPTGATASFNPASLTSGGTSTLTISTSSSTAAGTYPITLTGTGPAATHSTTFTLTVNPAPSDFSISASPSSLSVKRGRSTSSTIGTTLTSGSAQSVSLTASGLPSGATASFNPASVTSGGSSTMRISVASSTRTGTYTITVTGTGTSATHSTTLTLTVR